MLGSAHMIIRTLISFLILAAWVGTASAQPEAERVKLYKVEIEVAKDGTLDIVETITLHVEGREYQRGFIRSFPTRYKDKLGNRVRVGFEVKSVQRDGRSETYALESISNGYDIRIGRAEVILTPGDYTYRLEYETKGQLGFFENHDELYYNAIGHGWTVPIERAEIDVRLPSGARVTDAEVFTGSVGSTDSDAIMSRGDNTFHAETTRTLSSYQGVTIAVGWQKGIVTPPTDAEKAERFLGENLGIGIGILGLLLIAAYYGYVWHHFGRDPDGGTIIPLFSPPKNFSPSAVRFVRRMGYDRKAFAAAIMSMAVKNYLEIEDKDGEFTLVKKKGATDAALTEGEKRIVQKLFVLNDSITLKNSNHKAISSAVSVLGSSLKQEFERTYFVTNQAYFWLGLLASIAIAVGAVILGDLPEEMLGAAFGITIVSAILCFALYRAYESWRVFFAGVGSRFTNTMGALGSTFFVLVALGAGVAALFAFSQGDVPWLFILIFVALGTMNFVFYHLLKAPTALGAKTRAEIEGFRMYMGTVEKERLAILHPPEMTPELFEKFLPFALALDVEHSWSEHFASVAAAAADDATRNYQPAWYHGNRWNRFGSSGFASNLASSLSTATAAAASPPGSSSGLGGGGFSGGGGGGGGGRGW